MKIPKDERRSLEQIREQYEIEKELSDRLRNAEKRRGDFYILNSTMNCIVEFHITAN